MRVIISLKNAKKLTDGFEFKAKYMDPTYSGNVTLKFELVVRNNEGVVCVYPMNTNTDILDGTEDIHSYKICSPCHHQFSNGLYKYAFVRVVIKSNDFIKEFKFDIMFKNDDDKCMFYHTINKETIDSISYYKFNTDEDENIEKIQKYIIENLKTIHYIVNGNYNTYKTIVTELVYSLLLYGHALFLLTDSNINYFLSDNPFAIYEQHTYMQVVKLNYEMTMLVNIKSNNNDVKNRVKIEMNLIDSARKIINHETFKQEDLLRMKTKQFEDKLNFLKSNYKSLINDLSLDTPFKNEITLSLNGNNYNSVYVKFINNVNTMLLERNGNNIGVIKAFASINIKTHTHYDELSIKELIDIDNDILILTPVSGVSDNPIKILNVSGGNLSATSQQSIQSVINSDKAVVFCVTSPTKNKLLRFDKSKYTLFNVIIYQDDADEKFLSELLKTKGFSSKNTNLKSLINRANKQYELSPIIEKGPWLFGINIENQEDDDLNVDFLVDLLNNKNNSFIYDKNVSIVPNSKYLLMFNSFDKKGCIASEYDFDAKIQVVYYYIQTDNDDTCIADGNSFLDSCETHMADKSKRINIFIFTRFTKLLSLYSLFISKSDDLMETPSLIKEVKKKITELFFEKYVYQI